MNLVEEAEARLEQARRLGTEPREWIVSPHTASDLPIADGQLLGIPLTIAETRWGLQLVLAPRAA